MARSMARATTFVFHSRMRADVQPRPIGEGSSFDKARFGIRLSLPGGLTPMFTYAVKEVVRVIDGDTVEILIDLGFNITIKQIIRIKV